MSENPTPPAALESTHYINIWGWRNYIYFDNFCNNIQSKYKILT